MLPNLCRNLAIRHLVNGFNIDDAPAQVVPFELFFQLALCVTRTKDKNSFRTTNTCNDRIIVQGELSRERSLAAIIRRYLLWFIGAFQ